MSRLRNLVRGCLGRGPLAALALAVCAIGVTPAARAASPYLEVVPAEEAMRSPAYRYANMTNEQAFAELDRRRVLYLREPATLGVRAPIRLTGRLHGVHVHSSLPPEQRPTTPFEVLDARLALAVDDFCAILARHDVDELVHYTMYRPNVPPAGWSPPLQAKAGPNEGEEPARKQPRSAKRRADAREPGSSKSLGKGAKGGKPAATGRSRAGRKELGDDDDALEPKCCLDSPSVNCLDSPSVNCLDSPSVNCLDSPSVNWLDDVDAYGKAAPSKPPVGKSVPKASKPKAGPRVASRRLPSALRRPPSREDSEELHTHRKHAPPGTRHPAGLAIDFGAVKKRDGRWLSVASHFRGRIGDRTCGVGAPAPESADARELRSIVCEARAAGVFTYALTPNFDADHVDHVHFEIKPGVTWFLYH